MAQVGNSGILAFDNSDLSLATKMYIDVESFTGQIFSASYLAAGDQVHIKSKNDVSRYAEFLIDVVTDMTTYLELDLNATRTLGTTSFNADEPVGIAFRQGSGIDSLNGETGDTQTFADVDDTNVTLAIASATNTHTFTMGWTGTLAVARGGTGSSTADGARTNLSAEKVWSYADMTGNKTASDHRHDTAYITADATWTLPSSPSGGDIARLTFQSQSDNQDQISITAANQIMGRTTGTPKFSDALILPMETVEFTYIEYNLTGRWFLTNKILGTPLVRLSRSSDLAITTGTETEITWNGTDNDDWNNGTNTTDITLPTDCSRVLVEGQMSMANPSGANEIVVTLYINGVANTDYRQSEQKEAVASGGVRISFSWELDAKDAGVSLDKGDTISLAVEHDHGSDRNVGTPSWLSVSVKERAFEVDQA